LVTFPEAPPRPARIWIGLLLFLFAGNAAVMGVYLWRAKRRDESRTSFAQFFKCRPEDVEIAVKPRAGLSTDAQLKAAAETLRGELRDDAVLSGGERGRISSRDGLVAYDTVEGTLRLPDGTRADWVQDGFLTIRFSVPGRSEATRTLLLAPRSWLQKDL
jgi:hypothetical protein